MPELTHFKDGQPHMVDVSSKPSTTRTATARTTAQTGVEMEALTAVSIASLTVYDMLKAASKGIEITRLRLLEKTGGKSGDYRADRLPQD